jgi:hypothetical protein
MPHLVVAVPAYQHHYADASGCYLLLENMLQVLITGFDTKLDVVLTCFDYWFRLVIRTYICSRFCICGECVVMMNLW